jgi:hypothetical protein
MTKPPRDAGEIDKVREAILDAAVEIMHGSGFQGLTMRRIASSMKMSATNLYNYFSNKDDIYIHILIRGFRLLYEDLRLASEKDDMPLEKAKAFIRSYLHFGMHNHHYYEIMFSPDLPKYHDYIGSPFETVAKIELDYSEKIIALAMDIAGNVMKFLHVDDLEAVKIRMIEIWCTLHGMILLRRSNLVGYAVDNPEQLFDQIIENVLIRQ